jgi:iron complex outermembrane recepter protein
MSLVDYLFRLVFSREKNKEKKMKCYKVFLVALSLAVGVGPGAVASGIVELEPITVTPYRYPQEAQKTSASVSIITQDEIEDSTAQTIPDILRTQAGLVVRDYYGTGNQVSVDLRGFGETAGSNTLVLVDGRRVNEIDLSGVDWAQIPIDRVERIEVVRGPHSVLYGDNAVGGVINIITKKGKGEPAFEIETTGGSYDMNNQKISFSGSQDEFSYFLGASRHYIRGYRENSRYKTNDFSTSLTYDFSDSLSFDLSGGYKDSEFGLPGPLLESDLDGRSRRDTKYPDDEVEQRDWFLYLDLVSNPYDNFQINIPFSFRQKKVDNNLRSSSYVGKNNINTLGFTPSFKLEKEIFGKGAVLSGGIDLYRSTLGIDDYSFQGYDIMWAPTNYYEEHHRETNIDKSTLACYLQGEFFLLESLTLNSGYRYERAKYTFDSQPLRGPWEVENNWDDMEVDERLKVREEGLSVGLNYAYSDFSCVFMRFSKGYRLPATDEYYSLWATPPVNIGLRPQNLKSYELGLNHKINSTIDIGLTLFNMDLKNELYYDPLTFENKNYNDKTRRIGVELELQWRPLEQLSFSSSYTYVEAYFRGGEYNRNHVPMVPRHKASLSSAWQVSDKWQIDAVFNYIGSRFFISDHPNEYPKMEDHITVDLKSSYRLSNSRIFFGINNIFDKKYSEYGVISTMQNERGYYPSPGRNFIAGCSFKF